MAYERVCKVCNTKFISRIHNAAFCCEDCRKWAREQREEEAKEKKKDGRVEYDDWSPKYKEPASMRHLRAVANTATKYGMSYGEYMAGGWKKTIKWEDD